MAHTKIQDYAENRSEPLLTLDELRLWLACSRSTAYRLLQAGELSPVYLDDRPRFVPDDVRALIERRRTARPEEKSA